MTNLAVFHCFFDGKPRITTNASHLDQNKPYKNCVLYYTEVYCNGETEVYLPRELDNLSKYLTKEYILLSKSGFVDFNLIALHMESTFEISNCAGCVCVTDFARSLCIKPQPMNNPEEVISLFKTCISHRNFPKYEIINVIDQHWITHGSQDRVINDTSGKWMVFVDNRYLDKLWNIVVENEKEFGYQQARTSTSMVNIWSGTSQHGVIQMFYSGYNEDAITSFGEIIFSTIHKQFTTNWSGRIYYKTDCATMKKSKKSSIIIDGKTINYY